MTIRNHSEKDLVFTGEAQWLNGKDDLVYLNCGNTLLGRLCSLKYSTDFGRLLYYRGVVFFIRKTSQF